MWRTPRVKYEIVEEGDMPGLNNQYKKIFWHGFIPLRWIPQVERLGVFLLIGSNMVWKISFIDKAWLYSWGNHFLKPRPMLTMFHGTAGELCI